MKLKKVQMFSGIMIGLLARSKIKIFPPLVVRTLIALLPFIALPAQSTDLNDTGITDCGDASSSVANCATVAADGGLFPRQDGRIGRDPQAAAGQFPGKTGGKGFDFSKIANDGTTADATAALGTGAKDWACTRDNVTGLMWEVKTSSGLRSQSYKYTWYQATNGMGVASKVTDAATCFAGGRCDTEKYAADVNQPGLCGSAPGSNEWRMPTVKELENIADYGQVNPAIDGTYFPNTPASYYWSGTNDSSYPGQFAWIVEFMNGSAGQAQPLTPQHVRLVRGTLATSTYKSFTFPNGDTVVTDERTGLMWKRDHEMIDPSQPDDWQTLVNSFTWKDALQRAVNDRTGGYSDWRLPNIRELRSLIDETRHSPAMDPAFMPTPFQSMFWSSSPYKELSGNQSFSWTVSFDAGGDPAVQRYFREHARLVRGGDAFDSLGGTISISPSPLVFPAQGLNTSAMQTIRLSNTGMGIVSLNGITASGTDYTQTNNCSATLAAGASCSISVSFIPSALGSRSGAVTIASNAPGSPHTVNLSGSGTQVPGVSLSPGALVFTAQNVGTSAVQTIKLDNTGTGLVTITSITASGTDYTQNNDCGATLAAGSSCSIGVTFTPAAIGSRSGIITIISDAPGSPHSLGLAGTGMAVQFAFGVTKSGTGAGTVVGSPTGINCGGTCSASYASGTAVTLTATPTLGSIFAGWSGAGCSGTGTCTVSMSAAQSVIAAFTLVDSYTLTVTKSGTGGGTVVSTPSGLDCGPLCSVFFTSGSSVTLTATADAGSTFAGWSGGGCSGTGACTVSMSATQSVTATFTASGGGGNGGSFALTVNKLGTGGGTVSSPSGLNCGPLCSVFFTSGSSVTLSAAADTGSTFAGWSGGLCSGTGTCIVSMTATRTVTATFTVNPYTLTVSKSGTGAGTVSSSTGSGLYCGTVCSVGYPSGTSVTLNATATTGNTFTGWSGAGCSGTGNTCIVSMSAAQSVTATFTVNPYTLAVSKSGTGAGTVSSSTGPGLYCGSVCSVVYPSGTSVTLNATATTGSTFTGWSGAGCSGTGTCIVSMSAAQSVTASFTADPYTLAVSKSGTGAGTVSSSTGPGLYCGSVCSVVYPSGTSVTLNATATTGSTFTGWSGAGCSGTGTCIVSMSAAQSVTATFTANPYTLTVSKSGNGAGTVSSTTGPGLYCGSVCSVVYPNGTSVTLNATATTGSTFTGWSGAGCSGTGTCIVSTSAAQAVTATFTANPYTLTVTKSGTGAGAVSSTAGSGLYCGSVCSVDYPNGTSVTLSAIANTGSTFTGWNGAGCSGLTCTVPMNQAQSVTATFTLGNVDGYLLTVTPAGTGTGTVVSSPSGINCGAPCSATFNNGTGVTLSATAATGSTFGGWSGAGCSGTGTCIVSMSAAQSVTAAFNVIDSYTLTVSKSGAGGGAVLSSPSGVNCGALCSATFTNGASVTLNATATTGSTFAGWGGACSGTGSCIVTMNQTQNVTATFTPVPVGLYDGIYQWEDGTYLSVHEIGGRTLIGTIYWVYKANSVQAGTRTVAEADAFDLFNGPLVGTSATMTGTRFFRACTLAYDFTFNSDSSLTVRLNNVSNTTGVSKTDVDCAAKHVPVGTSWTIPRIS